MQARNAAEAEFWRRSRGTDVADSSKKLNFECGGSQWKYTLGTDAVGGGAEGALDEKVKECGRMILRIMHRAVSRALTKWHADTAVASATGRAMRGAVQLRTSASSRVSEVSARSVSSRTHAASAGSARKACVGLHGLPELARQRRPHSEARGPLYQPLHFRLKPLHHVIECRTCTGQASVCVAPFPAGPRRAPHTTRN